MRINLVTIIQKPSLWPPFFTRLFTAYALVCFFLISAPTQAQQTIQWEPDFEKAHHVAKRQNKLVLLHFTASWSVQCRNVTNLVHSESQVSSAIRDNVIAVKVDVDKHPELVEQYEVPSVPYEVVLTPNKKIVAKRKSPINSSAYFKMITEWVGSFNNSQRVNHAMADLHHLDLSTKPLSKSLTTTFSPTTPNDFATAPPAHQIKKTTEAFTGPKYQKLETRNQEPEFTQAHPGKATKNHFSVPPAKQPDRLAKTADAAKADRISKLDLPEFQLPSTRTKATNTEPSGSNQKLPTNDFRPPSPPRLGNPPTTMQANLNTDSSKTKLKIQFKPSTPTLKSPTVSPKQLLAAPASPLKKLDGVKSIGITTPTYALRGKCPVSLLTQEKWINGNPQWGCVHRNQVYIFSSEVNLKKFKENPESYSPILAGFDPVVFHESGKLTPGLLNHGVFMGKAPNQRIILFSDSLTRARFQESPKQFLETVRQAMKQTDSMDHFRR